ncbi:replication restart helicase PriA [Fusibacter tunisiensis]|uniref:Replication restart protein PriA n=1 Tax=Fusibacter tunisiensis TaxID=1008308 RepID=A0ABS2MMA7_9FIRM|nr:primosomal protein N' [Fusibacter tunisiensis]MBM7560534.1 primosomal protein N' (replication factor Y) [Fusibacter tunisiensis]
MYADVILLRSTGDLDMTFTYRVPDELKSKVIHGARVIVPFGVSKFNEAIIFKTYKSLETPVSYKVKEIAYVFSDGVFLTESELELIETIHNLYLCSYTEAAQLFMPMGTLTHQYRVFYPCFTEDSDLTLSECELKLLKTIELEPISEDKLIGICSDNKRKNALKRLIALKLIKYQVQFESVVKDRYVEWIEPTETLGDFLKSVPNRYKAQKSLGQYMQGVGSAKRLDVQDAVKVSKSVVDRLVDLGHLKVTHKEALRKPEFMNANTESKAIHLSVEQKSAYDAILSGFFKDHQQEFLLHGVTGSGKTEVYAELIESVVKNGQKAILMVPEIALTPQIVSRFAARFGSDRIALIHSKISPGEKYDQWKQIRAGQFDLIIGARSAIFAPVTSLGLIILDESHESTYKSEKRPKYDTYEIAKMRIEMSGGILISGSATPSITEYYSALSGERALVKLDSRYNAQKVPEIEIVDMREELVAGNRSILSERLYQAIETRLERKEQTIILLNRKGHSTFVSCRSCGFALACPNCDVTLTYFKGEKTVRCNYCGYESYVPKKCPSCGSDYFKYFGVGTEKVEEELRTLFKDAVISRMDRTTTQRKGSIEKIITDVETHKTDILIGTQMVAKGFNFKRVTLIGILSADLMLNFPSFQSSERAYQLFNQVAGRAGRGDIPGQVILQTYVPDHYAINHTEYEAFYRHELDFRKQMRYPPFSRIVNLLFSSKEETLAESFAKKSRTYLNQRILKNRLQNEIEIFDANPALLKKIDGNYRWQVLIKVNPAHMDFVRQYVKNLEKRLSKESKCKLNVDLNASNIL